jgi:hypothetical protein
VDPFRGAARAAPLARVTSLATGSKTRAAPSRDRKLQVFTPTHAWVPPTEQQRKPAMRKTHSGFFALFLWHKEEVRNPLWVSRGSSPKGERCVTGAFCSCLSLDKEGGREICLAPMNCTSCKGLLKGRAIALFPFPKGKGKLLLPPFTGDCPERGCLPSNLTPNPFPRGKGNQNLLTGAAFLLRRHVARCLYSFSAARGC